MNLHFSLRPATHALVVLLLVACDGDGLRVSTIGGSVAGLSSGKRVSLQNNGGDTTSVTANGTFTFSTSLAIGSPYKVTVLTQPVGQTCGVNRGSGTVAAANIADISVACSTNTYKISVTVAGLTGSGLVLEDNGADNLSISASGSVNFSAPVASGSPYKVTVLTQPAGQQCSIVGGAGTVDTVPISVAVNCAPLPNTWTWIGGSNIVDAPGVYGTLGVAAASNTPSARYGAISWLDSSGNVWLFGGQSFDSAGNQGVWNDLWEYSAGQWKWMSGANTINASGTYGTMGTAAAGNVPGARIRPVSWIDTSGNLWLFGGQGFDSAGNQGVLNDLWEYSAGQWKWVSGANTINASGTYGTKGSAAAGDVPGARFIAISWMDSSNNLWLFGGQGFDSAGNQGVLNDLWEYSAGQWKWVSGANTINASGIYGTKGSAAAANVPGARFAGNSWIDSSNNLWLFGGLGIDSAVMQGTLNDVWEYSAGQWQWVSGSNLVNASASYGTKGSAVASNDPGARIAANSWLDASGNVWLFGGLTIDSAGHQGLLNDLWEYSAGQWKWVSGANTINTSGSYGVKGIAAAGNAPGARYAAISWVDSSGNLWLFGGLTVDSTGSQGALNDAWRYSP